MIAIRQELRPFTAEDLAELPDDGNRYEIIGGQLIVSPSPSVNHQRTLGRLYIILDAAIDQHGTGETFMAPLDVNFGHYTQLQPDILVVLDQHSRRIRAGNIEGPPDLVVEIASKSTASVDRIRKAGAYAEHGVPEYWIVDPDVESIEVQTLQSGRYVTVKNTGGIARSSVIEGLEVDPKELFRPTRRKSPDGT